MKKNYIKKEYLRIRKNLQARINRYRRQGLEVDIKIPKIPKKITQGSINRLKRIDVKKNTFAPDLETGELISLQKFKLRKYKISEIQKLYDNVSRETHKGETIEMEIDTPSYYDVILEGFLELIYQYPPEAKQIFLNFYNKNIEVIGRERFASALEEAKNKGAFISPEEAYKDINIQMSLSKINRELDLDFEERNRFTKIYDNGIDIDEEFY